MNKPREFWIGVDENDSPRWLSGDPRFYPVSTEHKCAEVIHVREVTTEEKIWDEERPSGAV